MNKRIVTDFVTTGVIALIASLVVTYLRGLVFGSGGTVDWEASLEFAVTLSLVLTWLKARA